MADILKKAAKPAASKAPAKKAVKANEVKTLEQLQADLEQLQNDYRESRRSHTMGELVNPRVLTVQRKSIARAHTSIRQAQLSAKSSDETSTPKEDK